MDNSLNGLQKAVRAKFGHAESSVTTSVAAESANDFTAFMKSKSVTREQEVQPAEEPAVKTEGASADPEEKTNTSSSDAASEEVEKEPIGYDGKEIYDLKKMATSVTGAVIDNPESLTDMIMWGIEWIRSTFYPGLLYRVMFVEKERDVLEDVLAKFIDVDLVGESDELIPLRKDINPSAEEQKLLIKWRKFVKGLEKIKYSEKERATFADYIHSKVKHLSVDSIIATFGPVIGLMAMEAGKLTPFYMNRKASILNTYTNR